MYMNAYRWDGATVERMASRFLQARAALFPLPAATGPPTVAGLISRAYMFRKPRWDQLFPLFLISVRGLSDAQTGADRSPTDFVVPRRPLTGAPVPRGFLVTRYIYRLLENVYISMEYCMD